MTTDVSILRWYICRWRGAQGSAVTRGDKHTPRSWATVGFIGVGWYESSVEMGLQTASGEDVCQLEGQRDTQVQQSII